MSTISLRCKSCNGILDVDEEKEVLFCPYCGSKELIEDSDAVKIARLRTKAYRDVEIGKSRIPIELKELKIKDRREREKSDWKFAKKLWLILFLIVAIVFSVVHFWEKRHEYAGDIHPPLSASQCIGMDYRTVISQFEDRGFLDITVDTYEDGDEVTVTTIFINGNSSFQSSSWFPPDSRVRIIYGVADEPDVSVINDTVE